MGKATLKRQPSQQQIPKSFDIDEDSDEDIEEEDSAFIRPPLKVSNQLCY